MHDFRHNIDYVIIGKNMSKNSKKHKDNIAHKSLSIKPVIIGFFIIVLLVFALMMYKYRVDYDEFAKNNTFVQEKKWKRVNHNWPEPPEELRTYVGDGFYYFKYKYNGYDFWVRANDSNLKNSRSIYRFDTSTPSEILDESRVLEISGNSNKYIYEFIKGIMSRIN